MQVKYSYLDKQFARGTGRDAILEDIQKLVDRGDFTLGDEVAQFEEAFAKAVGAQYAVGVRSGTDALYLALKTMNIGIGDEVATVPTTFPATVGAIIQAGAVPRFMDTGTPKNQYNLLMSKSGQFPAKPSLKAIIPVDWAGDLVEIEEPRIGLAVEGRQVCFPHVIHDACQAVGASYGGKGVGSMGVMAAFSLHPLKNINVWGDGGVVTTNSPFVAQRLRFLRNHGLVDRNTWGEPSINGRLETIQAVVGLHVLKDLNEISEKRRYNASLYDERLTQIKGVVIPPRIPQVKHVYHLYVIQVENRDALVKHLNEKGIEAKVHYPTPLHLQPALRGLGYNAGDFPNAEAQCLRVVSLPIHQYLTEQEIEYVCSTIKAFYASSGSVPAAA